MSRHPRRRMHQHTPVLAAEQPLSPDSTTQDIPSPRIQFFTHFSAKKAGFIVLPPLHTVNAGLPEVYHVFKRDQKLHHALSHYRAHEWVGRRGGWMGENATVPPVGYLRKEGKLRRGWGIGGRFIRRSST